MNRYVIDDAGLEACAALLVDLVEGAISLSIVSFQGKVLWTHSEKQTVKCDLPRWYPSDDSGWKNLGFDVKVRPQGIALQLFSREIKGDGVEEGLSLFLLHEAVPSQNSISSNHTAKRAVYCMSQLLGSHIGLNNELNSMTDELARRYEELNLVYNTDEGIRMLSERETLLNKIVETCIDHLEVDAAALCLIEQDDVIASQRNAVQEDLINEVNSLRTPIFNLMLRHGSSVVLNTPQERERAGLEETCKRKLVVSPIRDSNDRLRGALIVFNNTDSRDFENGDRNLMNVTAEKLSKVIGADYDGLTGLVTREGFELAVRDILTGAARRERDICLLHANIDQLQLVNDTFGHNAGDELIQKVSATLSQLLRENDRVSRLGGDEFGILLFDCSLENATKMADRVCEHVSMLKCESGDRRLDVGISM